LLLLANSILVELLFLGSRFGYGDGEPVNVPVYVERHGGGSVHVTSVNVILQRARAASDVGKGYKVNVKRHRSSETIVAFQNEAEGEAGIFLSESLVCREGMIECVREEDITAVDHMAIARGDDVSFDGVELTDRDHNVFTCAFFPVLESEIGNILDVGGASGVDVQ